MSISVTPIGVSPIGGEDSGGGGGGPVSELGTWSLDLATEVTVNAWNIGLFLRTTVVEFGTLNLELEAETTPLVAETLSLELVTNLGDVGTTELELQTLVYPADAGVVLPPPEPPEPPDPTEPPADPAPTNNPDEVLIQFPAIAVQVQGNWVTDFTGEIEIEAEEGVARVATLKAILSGEVNVSAGIGKTIKVTYNKFTIFQGKIDEVVLIPEEGLMEIHCSDRLQQAVNLANPRWVRELFTVDSFLPFSSALQGTPDDNWDLVQTLSKTTGQSLDLDVNGSWQLSSWNALGDPTWTYDQDNVRDIETNLAANSSQVKACTAYLYVRHEALHQRKQIYNWTMGIGQIMDIKTMADLGIIVPSVDLVMSAIAGTGWHLTDLPRFAHPEKENSYSYYNFNGGATEGFGQLLYASPEELCISADFELETRWKQPLITQYSAGAASDDAPAGNNVKILEFTLDVPGSTNRFYDMLEDTISYKMKRKFAGGGGMISVTDKPPMPPITDFEVYQLPFPAKNQLEDGEGEAYHDAAEYGSYLDSLYMPVRMKPSAQIYQNQNFTVSALIWSEGVGELILGANYGGSVGSSGNVVSVNIRRIVPGTETDAVPQTYVESRTLEIPSSRVFMRFRVGPQTKVYSFSATASRAVATGGYNPTMQVQATAFGYVLVEKNMKGVMYQELLYLGDRVRRLSITPGTGTLPIEAYWNLWPGDDFYWKDYVSHTNRVLAELVKSEIKASARDNYVTFTTTLNPLLERSHTVKVDAKLGDIGYLTAQGKVHRFSHQIDLTSGACLSTITVAVNLQPSVEDSGVLPDVPPGPLVLEKETGYNPADVRYLGTYIGMVPGQTPPWPRVKLTAQGIIPLEEDYDAATGYLKAIAGYATDATFPPAIVWNAEPSAQEYFGYGGSFFTVKTPPISTELTKERLLSKPLKIVTAGINYGTISFHTPTRYTFGSDS